MKKQKVYHVVGSSDIMDQLTAWKIPFKVTFTNQTTIIQTDKKKWICSDGRFTFQDLHFMQRVKKSIRVKEEIKYIPPRYFHFNALHDGTYTDVTERDISGAYWETAFKQGYIPEKIYLEGLEVEKPVRLAAFGAIAVNKVTYLFTGTESIKLPTVQTDEEKAKRSVFFAVASHVDGALLRAMQAAGQAALWMWVDALFLRKEKADLIAEYLEEKEGYKTKEVLLSFIDVRTEGQTKFYDAWLTNPKNPKKPFKTFSHGIGLMNRQREIYENFLQMLEKNTDL